MKKTGKGKRVVAQKKAKGGLAQKKAKGGLAQKKVKGGLAQKKAKGRVAQKKAKGSVVQKKVKGPVAQKKAKGRVARKKIVRRPPSATSPVSGYPLYDATSGGAAAEPGVLMARYQAGYAILLGPDASALYRALNLPGNDVAQPAVLPPVESTIPEEQQSPAAERELDPNATRGPRGIPAPPRSAEMVVRNVLAKGRGGELRSLQAIGANLEAVQAAIESWRSKLSSAAEGGTHAKPARGARKRLAAADTGSQASSDVNPDPNAWTLLGGVSHSVGGRGWFSPWYYNVDWKTYDTGRSEATVSLYRLNSKDAFDYFLVKTSWTVTPIWDGGFGHAFFYNRDHTLTVRLSADTQVGPVDGTIINFEPKTVATSQVYKVKFGGDLNGKIGEKPEIGGKANAEISTDFVIDSVSTIASTAAPALSWQLQHDYGPRFGNYPNTTIGGASATTWALYRFPRTINDGRPPMMKVSLRLTGNFGSWAEKWWGLKQFLVHGYDSSEQLMNFPVPTMAYEPTYTAQRPLEIAPGATASVSIRAGAQGLPLNWRPYEVPTDRDGKRYLAISPPAALGNGTLQITADQDAKVGLFGYVRVNSEPWTAADSLRSGPLDIPVKIVAR